LALVTPGGDEDFDSPGLGRALRGGNMNP